MKIKIKDKDNISIDFTHKELVIISESLLHYYDISTDVYIFNQSLYDEDEFSGLGELKNKIWNMLTNIKNTIYTIRSNFK